MVDATGKLAVAKAEQPAKAELPKYVTEGKLASVSAMQEENALESMYVADGKLTTAKE